MIVRTPTRDEVTGHAAKMYGDDLRADGFVSARTQVLAVNPEAHAAFENLISAVIPSIGMRTYELISLGAARSIRSGHCLLAHGRKALAAELMDEDQLERIARDYRDADLSDADVAVMVFAEKLSTDAAAMTDADTETLRDHGYSDRQIVDITLTAAARNFLSRALQALAVPLDDVPGLSPRLRNALLSSTL